MGEAEQVREGEAEQIVFSFREGSKVIFWLLSFVRCNCHISFKFSTEMQYSLIFTHIVLVMLLLVLTIV